jgi:hypothetical protein
MKNIYRYLIILTLLITINTQFVVQGLNFKGIINQLQLPNILCLFIPNYKLTITKSELPSLKLKIPCQWTYKWTSTDYFNDGEIDYTLTISIGSMMVHKMYFFYFAAGCAEDSCYKPLTGDHYLISSKHSKHLYNDPNLDSLLSPTPYNTHYKSYQYYNSQYQSFFPFGLATTNHISGNIRVVYATANKLSPYEQYKADNVITSSVF